MFLRNVDTRALFDLFSLSIPAMQTDMCTSPPPWQIEPEQSDNLGQYHRITLLGSPGQWRPRH